MVLVSNTSGKVSASAITTTQIGYLKNAKSNIQEQINNKNYIKEKKQGGIFSVEWDGVYINFFIDSTRVARIKNGSVIG